MGTTETTGGASMAIRPELPAPAAPSARVQDLAARMTELQRRAERGDEGASKAVVAAYHAIPGLWEAVGGLREHAERCWLDLLTPPASGLLFTREALGRELERRRRELAGAAPDPLERLLVDRVLISWLATVHADAQYAQRLAGPGGMPIKEGEYLQRRSERAQRQLLRAVQTLATVRRLLAPSIQLNIAEKQINVAR